MSMIPLKWRSSKSESKPSVNFVPTVPMRIKDDNTSEVVDITAENAGTATTYVSTNTDPEAAKMEEYLHNVAIPAHEKEMESLQETSGYRIKRTPATFRRIQTLGLSDANLTEMLKTHQGRIKFGYNYIERVQLS